MHFLAAVIPCTPAAPLHPTGGILRGVSILAGLPLPVLQNLKKPHLIPNSENFSKIQKGKKESVPIVFQYTSTGTLLEHLLEHPQSIDITIFFILLFQWDKEKGFIMQKKL